MCKVVFFISLSILLTQDSIMSFFCYCAILAQKRRLKFGFGVKMLKIKKFIDLICSHFDILSVEALTTEIRYVPQNLFEQV